jgi:hypothetical protein
LARVALVSSVAASLVRTAVRYLAPGRERRTGGDRRSGTDRRGTGSLADAGVATRILAAIDRRSGADRRSGQERRTEDQPSLAERRARDAAPSP